MRLTTRCISFEESPSLRCWKINRTACTELWIVSAALSALAGFEQASGDGGSAAWSPGSHFTCCKTASTLPALSWRLNVCGGFIPLVNNEGGLSAEI